MKTASVPTASQPKVPGEGQPQRPIGDDAKEGGGMSRRLPDVGGPVLFGQLRHRQRYFILTLGSRPQTRNWPSLPIKPATSFGRSQGNEALIDIGLGDPGFRKQRRRRFHMTDELAMGERVGDEIARGGFLQQIVHRGCGRQQRNGVVQHRGTAIDHLIGLDPAAVAGLGAADFRAR